MWQLRPIGYSHGFGKEVPFGKVSPRPVEGPDGHLGQQGHLDPLLWEALFFTADVTEVEKILNAPPTDFDKFALIKSKIPSSDL